MGYCTYTKRSDGLAVAAWIGTSGEKVSSKTVTFSPGSLGSTNKTAACNEARKQFCALNGGCVVTSPKSTYKAPDAPKTLSSSGSGSGSGQSRCSYQGGDFLAAPLTALVKYAQYQGCLLQGGTPDPGQVGPVSGDPRTEQLKTEICAKSCDVFDFGCQAAKVQYGCGGSSPLWWVLGGVGLIALIVILKRK